jgi:PTS system fructose-specific IIC component
MNFARYLTEDLIKLEMTTVVEPLADDGNYDKWLQNSKETILDELVTLLNDGARVGNKSKLLTDFINRERKATTGLAHGVAVPHIRSLQAKDFMLAFARSSTGYEFDAIDKQPSHLFFVMAAPPYDDQLYLRAFKGLSELVQFDTFRQELMDAGSEGEIIRIFRQYE